MTINPSPIKQFLDKHDEYHSFQRNHKIGVAAVVILGAALGAIGYYVLSHGMIPHFQHLGLSGNITVGAVAGASLLSIGLITVLASYILRVNKKREWISDEALLLALSRESSATALNRDLLLQPRFSKFVQKMDANRFKRFLRCVDFHYFSRPEFKLPDRRGGAGPVQERSAITVPIETKDRVMNALRAAVNDEVAFHGIIDEIGYAGQISPQFRNYLQGGEAAADYYSSLTVTEFIDHYKAEFHNRSLHVLSYFAFPVLTVIAIGIIAYMGGVLPHASLGTNIAYVSAGGFMFLSVGAIAVMLNYIRTAKKKRQNSNTEKFLIALSRPQSWKQLFWFQVRPSDHPLRAENYSGMLNYVDCRYFRDQTIQVVDDVRGRVLEAMIRFNPTQFRETYASRRANLSEEMQTFVEERMFEYIDRTYFPVRNAGNEDHIQRLKSEARPLIIGLFNLNRNIGSNYMAQLTNFSFRFKDYVEALFRVEEAQ